MRKKRMRVRRKRKRMVKGEFRELDDSEKVDEAVVVVVDDVVGEPSHPRRGGNDDAGDVEPYFSSTG